MMSSQEATNAQASYYMQASQNALGQNALGQSIGAASPQTISSAVGKVESLHKQLESIRGRLAALSDAIGGPRPISGNGGSAGKDKPPGGLVYRLNGAVEDSARVADHIDSLLIAIDRSLGTGC